MIPTSPVLSISVARDRDGEAIERFVAAHPQATIYHRPVFARIIRRAAGLAVATFIARDGAGAVAGVLPVALTRSVLFGTYATSLPFVNYGGVLAATPEAARMLLGAAWLWASVRGARHLVLRHSEDRPLDLPATRGKETLTLALPPRDPGALWKAIGSKTRNLVRKAQGAGVVATTEPANALGAFHAVFSENMRDLGTPALGEAFFRAILDELGGAAELHLVRIGRRAVGGAITIRFRDRVEVPWASCLRRSNAAAANMQLYWHMLERAAASGARVFDFGRSTPGSGPYRFKLQWGARPEPLPWYFVAPDGRAPTGDLSPTNPRFALAIRLWKRLPVGIARVIGAHLTTSLP